MTQGGYQAIIILLCGHSNLNFAHHFVILLIVPKLRE